ncbi:MAG: response regulator transcription factor [Deltaproteobacteria bacterium]|nr:response regulator transcription factor [Deltaproteobacteria bacterium]MBW2662102.1 response regulator transcription factor [Deltaproteobacteria bacterium]
MINVFVVCNCQILLKMLAQHLSSFDDINLIEMSYNKIEQEEPLKKTDLELSRKPDIILFASGTLYPKLKKKLQCIRKRFPDPAIIFLSLESEQENMEFDVVKWGVRGFLSSTVPAEILIDAVRRCYAGEIWASRKFTSKMMNDLEEEKQFANTHISKQEIPGQLTKQEVNVIMLIASGLSNAEIGKKLFISKNTVKTHINRIFKKINVKNRLQAAMWASEHLLDC